MQEYLGLENTLDPIKPPFSHDFPMAFPVGQARNPGRLLEAAEEAQIVVKTWSTEEIHMTIAIPIH